MLKESLLKSLDLIFWDLEFRTFKPHVQATFVQNRQFGEKRVGDQENGSSYCRKRRREIKISIRGTELIKAKIFTVACQIYRFDDNRSRSGFETMTNILILCRSWIQRYHIIGQRASAVTKTRHPKNCLRPAGKIGRRETKNAKSDTVAYGENIKTSGIRYFSTVSGLNRIHKGKT